MNLLIFSETNFLELIFGYSDYKVIIVKYLFAFLGVITMLMLDYLTRKKQSTRTPVNFSLIYLLKDNWARILLSMISVFIFLRFSLDILGLEPNMYVAYGIGLASDGLIEKLKNLRKKFVQTLKKE